MRLSPDGEEVVILDTAGLHGRFGLPDRKREWATLFKGEKSKREYNRPLRPDGGVADNNLMIDVSRNRVMDSANVEATPHGWSVYHITDKLNLIDRSGNTILKKHLLKDLKRDADGNYSAWLGIREYGCREGRFIRFTPNFALIPDNNIRSERLPVPYLSIAVNGWQVGIHAVLGAGESAVHEDIPVEHGMGGDEVRIRDLPLYQ